VRVKAEADVRLQAEEETRIKAEELARLQAEEEARIQAETAKARAKAEEDTRLQAEEEARIKAEKLVRLQAEEDARIQAEEAAKLQAEEEAKLKAEEAAGLQAEEKIVIQKEAAAKIQAEEEARIISEKRLDDEQSAEVDKPKLAMWSDRAKNWRDRLVSEIQIEGKKEQTVGTTASTEQIVEIEDGKQSDVVDKPKMAAWADRAKNWKGRLSLGSKNRSDATVESDINSEAATVGGNNYNSFPKVLFNDGGEADSLKEPEIGSI